MCDKELIVGYLYGELSDHERAAFDTHLSVCADCRIEVGELRATRQHLGLWAPPEPDLGFRVIRGGTAPAPALPRRSPVRTAFAYAAAAVVVIAAGSAFANLEVRYGSDGFTVRTGWSRSLPETASGQAAGIGAAQPGTVPTTGDFAVLDKRLREIESALNAAAAPAPLQASAETRLSDAEMLRRVRQIVAEAEARQDTAVAERLVAVMRDLDVRRRTDMALIQQGLAQYQTLTNADIAQNRDMVNQLFRVSTRQEK